MDSLTFLLLTNILLTLATAQDTKTARFCEKDNQRTSSLSCTEAGTVINILNVTLAYTHGTDTCSEPTACPFHHAAVNNTFTNYVLSICSAQPNCSLSFSYLRNNATFPVCGAGGQVRNTANIEYICRPSAGTTGSISSKTVKISPTISLTTTYPASSTSNLMYSPRADSTQGGISRVTSTVTTGSQGDQEEPAASQVAAVKIIIPVLCCLLIAAVILIIVLVIRKRRKQSKPPKAAVATHSKDKRPDISNGENLHYGVENQSYSAVISFKENERNMSAVPHSTTTELYQPIPELVAPSAQPEPVYNQVKRSKDNVYVNTDTKGESQVYFLAEFDEGISSWNSSPTYDLPFESDSQGAERPSTLALHSKVNERLTESISLTDNPLYVASPV